MNDDVALHVSKANHLHGLEQKRRALTKDPLAVLLLQFCHVDIDWPDLSAGDGRVRGVFGHANRTLEAARLGAGQMTRHTWDLWVIKSLDDDLVVRGDPVVDC